MFPHTKSSDASMGARIPVLLLGIIPVFLGNSEMRNYRLTKGNGNLGHSDVGGSRRCTIVKYLYLGRAFPGD